MRCCEREGFLLLPSLISEDEVSALLSEIERLQRLCCEFDETATREKTHPGDVLYVHSALAHQLGEGQSAC